MGAVIRRLLAHASPEELLLVPVVIILGIVIFAQPAAITRLFDTPFATPIPGDSPADVIMNNRTTPAPAPSPVTRERGDLEVFAATRPATLPIRSLDCPAGLTAREVSVALQPNAALQTLRLCVDADGSVVTWDGRTGQQIRLMIVPGSIAGR